MPVFVVFGLLRWLQGVTAQLTTAVICLCTLGILFAFLVELGSNIYRHIEFDITPVPRAHVKTRHQGFWYLGRYSLIRFSMQTFSGTLDISTRAHDICFGYALFWNRPFLEADVHQYKGYWNHTLYFNICTRERNIHRVQRFCYKVPFSSTPGPFRDLQCIDGRNCIIHQKTNFLEKGLNLTLVFPTDQPDLVVGTLLTWKSHHQTDFLTLIVQ